MLSSVVAAFVLAASVNQVAANPSRHLYAARAYAQDAHLLEDYDTYHVRYLSIGCPWKKKNDDASFKQCCHPLQKDGGSVSAACTAPAQTNTSPGEQQPTSSSSYAPAATPTSSNSGSETYTGGHGTYFYQNGVAGACGIVHGDNDNIVAVDYRRYGDLSKQSDLCGKKVLVTNTNNGKSVVCTVADACPTCDNGNSLDLSEGAFKSLASLDEGLIPIKYTIL